MNGKTEKVIFDFETAVADLLPCYKKAFSESFSQFKIPYEESAIDEYVSSPLEKTFEKYYTGCTCRYRDFVTKFIGVFDRNFGLCTPMPGIEDTMKIVSEKGMDITVVSRSYELYANRFLTEHGLSGYVKEVLGKDRSPDLHSAIVQAADGLEAVVITADGSLTWSNLPRNICITGPGETDVLYCIGEPAKPARAYCNMPQDRITD